MNCCNIVRLNVRILADASEKILYWILYEYLKPPSSVKSLKFKNKYYLLKFSIDSYKKSNFKCSVTKKKLQN